MPVPKQQRVIFWLDGEGKDSNFSTEKFLQYVVLDREGEKKALGKLDRLRQGGRQKFDTYGQEFEQLVAGAGTLAPTGP